MFWAQKELRNVLRKRTFTRQVNVVQFLQAPDTRSDTDFSWEAAYIKKIQKRLSGKGLGRQKQANQYLQDVDIIEPKSSPLRYTGYIFIVPSTRKSAQPKL